MREIPPIQGNLRGVKIVHHLAHHGALGLQGLRVGDHRNRLADRTHFQVYVDARFLIHLKEDAGDSGSFEALRFRRDLPFADWQQGQRIGAGLPALSGSGEPGGGLFRGNARTGHDCTRRIGNGSSNGGGLRQSRNTQ